MRNKNNWNKLNKALQKSFAYARFQRLYFPSSLDKVSLSDYARNLMRRAISLARDDRKNKTQKWRAAWYGDKNLGSRFAFRSPQKDGSSLVDEEKRFIQIPTSLMVHVP